MQLQADTLHAVLLRCATLHRETVKVLLQTERVPWQWRTVCNRTLITAKRQCHTKTFLWYCGRFEPNRIEE